MKPIWDGLCIWHFRCSPQFIFPGTCLITSHPEAEGELFPFHSTTGAEKLILCHPSAQRPSWPGQGLVGTLPGVPPSSAWPGAALMSQELPWKAEFLSLANPWKSKFVSLANPWKSGFLSLANPWKAEFLSLANPWKAEFLSLANSSPMNILEGHTDGRLRCSNYSCEYQGCC
uniref:Uncharacterized protein n=1 Tax=Serinus canaria TaxID=9135 RepID=A0A8C9NNR7_SERCA